MVAVKSWSSTKKSGYGDLADAVKHDFKGYDPCCALIDEEAPQVGATTIPEADAMVIDLTSFIIKKIAAFRGLLGNQKLPALYPVSSNVPQGMAVGALPRAAVPSGPLRKAVPLSGRGPHRADRRILFARQAPARLHRRRHAPNLKFTPASVEGEAGRIRLSAFLKSFLDLDVFHVQFNVGPRSPALRSGPPRGVQILLVRVAGYSAYFVELSREVQDDILSRTAHAL